jgi:hypothetical protein
LKNGTTILGAIGDLSGDGTVHGNLSPALAKLQQPGAIPIKTAFIVGVATSSNYASLGGFSFAQVLRSNCDNPALGTSDPLTVALLSPTAWPALFPGDSSDAIVPLVSQYDGLGLGSVDVASDFQGVVHSDGIVGTFGLGFTAPSILNFGSAFSQSPVALQVITLLNTPVTQPDFNGLNP